MSVHPTTPLAEGPATSWPNAPARLFARFAPFASVGLGLLVIALIWLAVAVSLMRERAKDEHAALQNASNLARAFEEQIIRSLSAADQMLLYIRENYQRNRGQIDVALWSRPFQSLGDLTFQVAVIDRNGILAASTIESDDPVNLGDREHFRVHAERGTDELYISKPVVGRVSGRPSIQLTRRIRAPDGSFGGVMVLSIDPNYFRRLYETIELGSLGSISLIGTDGVVRTHGSNARRVVGRSIAGGRLLTEFAQAKSGSYRATSHADGIERLVTYRQVKGYPLIVSVDLSVDEVFASFEKTRWALILAAALLTAAIVPLTILIIRYEKGLARARDAAEAGIRARSEFLAVMSHEIRTPMNAVLGFAGSLLESRLDPEQRLSASALHAAGDDLLRILNDILDFSRLEAGRISFETIPFSPAGVIETTASIVAPGAAAKGLALRFDIDPALPPALRGDAGRLRQVLLNLLTNAIKFTNHGTITVAARCLDRSRDGATVEWSVTDQGIGMAPDRAGGVFGEFVQADSSVSRRFGGSGLGLAICKRIIDQMHGHIGATSVLGQGSRFAFSVTLPVSTLVAEAETAAGSGIDDLKAYIAGLGRPLRILLAEDNPTNQLVGKQMLRDLDASIAVASNGAEAVQSSRDFSYDIVLMDMQMPEMSGIQATRAIRARGGACAMLPIVALTANAYPEDVKACLDAGMNSFVAKPVRKGLLVEAMLRVLPTANGAVPGTAIVPEVTETGIAPDASVLVERSVVREVQDEIGAETFEHLLKIFTGETERRLTILRDLAYDERITVHREAHTLKGASATLGLVRLAELARQLEVQSATIEPGPYSRAVEELAQTYRVSIRELQFQLQKSVDEARPLAI